MRHLAFFRVGVSPSDKTTWCIRTRLLIRAHPRRQRDGEGACGEPTGRRHRVLARHASARRKSFVLLPFPNVDAPDKQPQAQ